jgi:hypothetical protein
MRAHTRLYHYKPSVETAMLQHLFNRTFTSVVDFIYHKFYLRHVIYTAHESITSFSPTCLLDSVSGKGHMLNGYISHFGFHSLKITLILATIKNHI